MAQLSTLSNSKKVIHKNLNQQGILSKLTTMAQAEQEQPIPPGAKECAFCYHFFGSDLPHLDCSVAHNNPGARFNVCQPCLFGWLHGESNADNVGFRRVRCNCHAVLRHDEIKAVLSEDQFEQYDTAMTKSALELMNGVVYCPGADCPNAFVKPKRKRTGRQCRKAVCSEEDGGCGTVFCCWCGEEYTKEHQRMKCGPYKKWKLENDEDARSLQAWKRSRIEQEAVMPCPRCKRDVEKNGGCRSMKCTNCRCNFCWNCGEEFRHHQCGCS